MRRSSERILTTHMGSLPQPRRLHDRLAGKDAAPDSLDREIRDAVAAILKSQHDSGLDIVNDGEQGKSSWSAYVENRLAGLSGPKVPRPRPLDADDFPDFYVPGAPGVGDRTSCGGPLSWKDFSAVEADIANLKAAAAGRGDIEIFMSASSPGNISNFYPNGYYPSEEAYLYAIADVMQREYEAIYQAGFILQLDCPDLSHRAFYFPEASDEEFRRTVALRVEALNHATRNIPPEAMRAHVCWGRTETARVHDQDLPALIGEYLKLRPAGMSIPASNGRHEHEWKIWRDVKLPAGKILIPGVVDNTSGIVEHPETVADRIIRYAELLGRENVMAGVNCGFGNVLGDQMPDIRIVWAKFRALADGAALASKALWA